MQYVGTVLYCTVGVVVGSINCGVNRYSRMTVAVTGTRGGYESGVRVHQGPAASRVSVSEDSPVWRVECWCSEAWKKVEAWRDDLWMDGRLERFRIVWCGVGRRRQRKCR